MMYDYALENDIVNKNHAEFIMLPEKGAPTKDRFTDLELTKIEQSAGKIPYADCILLLCYTGFRINEFLSLTKFGVHQSGKLTLLVGGEKTESGKNRPLPVHPKIKPYLDNWLAKDGDAIVCTEDGKAWTPDGFRRQCYYPALEAMGLRRLFHTLPGGHSPRELARRE